MIALIFHIQEEFKGYYHKFIEILIEEIKNSESKSINIKRVAIDAIYSIGAHCQEQIVQNKEEIL